jgi:Uma2 family endonuclease
MTFTAISSQTTNQMESLPELTLEAFLRLPESDESYELINGKAVKKMSPKFFHSQLTSAFWVELSAWADGRGRVTIEWSVVLKRNGKDWVPVPDLLYVSYNRLSREWIEDAPCPVLPELAIEIISPDQTFNQLAQKATDYLNAGIDRVWVVYPPMRSITVFFADRPPKTYYGDRSLTDELFADLTVRAEQFFVKAGI